VFPDEKGIETKFIGYAVEYYDGWKVFPDEKGIETT